MIGHVVAISLYFHIYGSFIHYDISQQTLRISLMLFPLVFKSEYVPARWQRSCIVPSTRIARFIHLKPLTKSNVIIGSRDEVMSNMIGYSKIGRLLLPPLHLQCSDDTLTLVMNPMSSLLVFQMSRFSFIYIEIQMSFLHHTPTSFRSCFICKIRVMR